MELVKNIISRAPLGKLMMMRKSSKLLCRIVDSEKIPFDFVQIHIADQGIHLRVDEDCDVKYSRARNVCMIRNGSTEKRFLNETPVRMARTDCGIILPLAKSIKMLRIVATRVFDEFFDPMFPQLPAYEVEVEVNRMDQVLVLLRKLDPDVIRDVTLACASRRLDRNIFDSAHFLKATKWNMVHLPPIEEDDLDKFDHFEDFSVHMTGVSREAVLKIKEKMMSIETLKRCLLRSPVEAINVQLMAHVLLESVDDGIVVHKVYVPQFKCIVQISINLQFIEAIKI
ncbi:hypothetical protein B9Z55_008540 [Caenorhabditis nigoni]|nr:hypothetical protein B9Z55_008540 [Caenorhabditis nigoni]